MFHIPVNNIVILKLSISKTVGCIHKTVNKWTDSRITIDRLISVLAILENPKSSNIQYNINIQY